jgi:hypothetical protein
MIVRGLLRRHPELDLVRVQDVGLMEEEDPLILEWAARQGRVLLTHDVRTVVGFAYERVRRGLRMPGVLEVKGLTLAQAIEEILIFALCSRDGEWENRVAYIPL